MNFLIESKQLLEEVGPGHMMTTAYDTAWVAQLAEMLPDVGNKALLWLRQNQLKDGSWGASEFVYHHDRVICTLAAIIALRRFGNESDNALIQNALPALENHLSLLDMDPAGETIGFELVVPTLLKEAASLGILSRRETGRLGSMTRTREAKLSMTPNGLIGRHVTMAFSAEMAGDDGVKILNVNSLQESNGSVGNSPSATAYFLLKVKPGDPQALNYLNNILTNGGAPNVAPFDVFERSWVLWNFSLANLHYKSEYRHLFEPHVEFLRKTWQVGKGIGFSALYTPKDGDETAIVYEVLKMFGRSVPIDDLLKFEEEEYFRCFDLESNVSLSTNIHVLGALDKAGLSSNHPSVKKILKFLGKNKIEGRFWIDKWHSSPYYTTSHAVMSLANYHHGMAQNAIEWILETQNRNGSWGYYFPTAEETAYSLQALTFWRRKGHKVSDDVLLRGAKWLKENASQPYPPLWIGKCLYSPILVVRSAILSALMMVEDNVKKQKSLLNHLSIAK